MHEPPRYSRREFGLLTGSALAAFAFGQACDAAGSQSRSKDEGRIAARPQSKTKTSVSGEQKLGLGGSRDAILRLPPNASDAPLPLLVLLHGASGTGERQLRRLGTATDDAGIAVLSPDSRDRTWDAILGDFGPDVAFLDRALQKVFSEVNVDPARVTLGGFSDGATYALSLGMINGDVFPRIIALSPGFIVVGTAHGKPRIFVSHGTNDEILPIDRCSRRIVPELRKGGYNVTYREFAGGHEMPPAIVTEAMTWMTAK